MDTKSELEKNRLAKGLAYKLQNLIRHFYQTEATKEDWEMLWNIYYTIIKLKPEYSFLSHDLHTIKGHIPPPGVTI
ncbi:MAG TPA: hypothetical protein PL110_18710 [Candidatus Eremiobacteraeota bacterium]|nr:MAG: hypothetical protein BWY64_03930 [bacterium ADurb.Bin363]HPZ10130.1 hypothetical protein [Candidatus Eremiobacteraeota bacterium]